MTIKVRLNDAIIHRGEHQAAGTELDLPANLARSLVYLGRAVYVQPEPETAQATDALVAEQAIMPKRKRHVSPK